MYVLCVYQMFTNKQIKTKVLITYDWIEINTEILRPCKYRLHQQPQHAQVKESTVHIMNSNYIKVYLMQFISERVGLRYTHAPYTKQAQASHLLIFICDKAS
ncbi:hypothetical protein EMCRGX_G016895 [Ephydatia muelleri]